MHADLATTELFARTRRGQAKTGCVIEMDMAGHDGFHRSRQRRGEMIVEAVEFDRNDVLAGGSKMQTGCMENRR